MSHVEESPAGGMNLALSRVLRGEVRAAGYSYDALAEAVGVSKSTIVRVLKDEPERHLSATLIAAICDEIGVDPVEVWGRAAARLYQRPEPGVSPEVAEGLEAYRQGYTSATRDEQDAAPQRRAGRRS